MKKQTINIPFQVILDSDGNGFSFVEDNRIHATTYGVNGKATKTLRELTAQAIDIALSNHEHSRKTAIGCGNGAVLVVNYYHPQWQYDTVGPDRKHSSCSMGWDSYEDCMESAKRHAESGYDGVKWICSF